MAAMPTSQSTTSKTRRPPLLAEAPVEHDHAQAVEAVEDDRHEQHDVVDDDRAAGEARADVVVARAAPMAT